MCATRSLITRKAWDEVELVDEFVNMIMQNLCQGTDRSHVTRRYLSSSFKTVRSKARLFLQAQNVFIVEHYLLSQTYLKCQYYVRRALPKSQVPDKFFFFFLMHYNFREVLAFSMNSSHLGRFLMQSLQFVTFIFVMSLFTSSSHLFLDLPR